VFTSLLFIVPAIVIVGLVLPLWLVLHYITLWKQQRSGGSADTSSLAALEASVRRLEDRIATLERVLDSEDPTWRERS